MYTLNYGYLGSNISLLDEGHTEYSEPNVIKIRMMIKTSFKFNKNVLSKSDV